MSTTIDQHTLTAAVSPLGLALDEVDASVTLDEGWSPYAQASITCKLPDAAAQDSLDLRDVPLRLDLRARQDFASPWTLGTLSAAVGGSVAALTAMFGGRPLSAMYQTFSRPWNAFGRRPSTSRRFDLLITDRRFDHLAGTVTITAASDEALLHSDALIATVAFDPATTSVRALAGMVLDRIGATLQPGTADGTVEAASTIWSPGVTAWDYIAPLAQAIDLKLWCDEQRRWWLTEVRPTAAGALVLTPEATITELSDTMQVVGDVWFDAVLITYKWTDSFDLNQTAYDAAGPARPRNVYRLDYDTPFPGPGAAASILNRAHGRGRVLDVRAVADYSTQPGQPVTITPPATETQTGIVSTVSWAWPGDEMTIGTRGLVDTPETSWLFALPGISWLSIPTGESWLEYEPNEGV